MVDCIAVCGEIITPYKPSTRRTLLFYPSKNCDNDTIRIRLLGNISRIQIDNAFQENLIKTTLIHSFLGKSDTEFQNFMLPILTSDCEHGVQLLRSYNGIPDNVSVIIHQCFIMPTKTANQYIIMLDGTFTDDLGCYYYMKSFTNFFDKLNPTELTLYKWFESGQYSSVHRCKIINKSYNLQDKCLVALLIEPINNTKSICLDQYTAICIEKNVHSNYLDWNVYNKWPIKNNHSVVFELLGFFKPFFTLINWDRRLIGVLLEAWAYTLSSPLIRGKGKASINSYHYSFDVNNWPNKYKKPELRIPEDDLKIYKQNGSEFDIQHYGVLPFSHTSSYVVPHDQYVLKSTIYDGRFKINLDELYKNSIENDYNTGMYYRLIKKDKMICIMRTIENHAPEIPLNKTLGIFRHIPYMTNTLKVKQCQECNIVSPNYIPAVDGPFDTSDSNKYIEKPYTVKAEDGTIVHHITNEDTKKTVMTTEEPETYLAFTDALNHNRHALRNKTGYQVLRYVISSDKSTQTPSNKNKGWQLKKGY